MYHNLAKIPIPKRMSHLPIWHGFPITHVTMTNAEGVPDFRTVNFERVHHCILDKCCGICGEPIKGWFCFIGGARSLENRIYTDPPMHRECAYYAAQVCPFLAGTRRQYADQPSRSEQNPDVTHVIRIEQERPTRMVLYMAKSYEVVRQGIQILSRPAKSPRRLDWNIMPPSSSEKHS